MIDFSLVLASAAAVSSFSGENALLAAVAFTAAAVLFAFLRGAKRGAAFVYAAAVLLLLHYLYTSYGAGLCAAFALFAVSACAAGRGGVCGAGRILFAVSIPFILLMPFFAGEAMPAARIYHLPFALAAGACTAHICKARPARAAVSGFAGACTGLFMRVCGGVCAELVTYAGIFFLLLAFVCGIITCVGRT
ncbi:MAG: hypothetical protein IJK33_08175 [Clostridia bacterium]|nr:hypothetical protein [Clostridia bacterium]